MWTRKQYLDGQCTHRQYYAQFVRQYHKDVVVRVFGNDVLKAAWLQDSNFNTIKLNQWDALESVVPHTIAKLIRDCGDYPTKAGMVCIFKEAALQVVEGNA